MGRLVLIVSLFLPLSGSLLLLRGPAITEQEQIVDFIRADVAKIDMLVDKVHEATGRLKELRTALISAAVTGKIDVREVVA